jgi:hypothetical protein
MCLLAVLLLPGAALALAGEAIISENVTASCAVSSQLILYSAGDSVSAYSPLTEQTSAWSMDLDPTETGWAGTGEIHGLDAAGGTVMVLLDLVPPVEEMYGMAIPSPVGVVCCSTDGTGARLLALTRESAADGMQLIPGGGWIAGDGFSRSAPDAERYLDYVTGEMAFELLEECNLVSSATGERHQLARLDLSLPHSWCPYAPRLLLRGDAPMVLVLDTEAPAVDSVFPLGETYPGIDVHRWVTERALTASYHGTRGLIFTDGRFAPIPMPGFRVRLWLSDDSYIFTDDGGTSYRHGLIDWSTFETSAAPPQPGLGTYVDNGVRPIPGAPTMLLHLRDGTLRLLTLTG